jgi:hypothetical protein
MDMMEAWARFEERLERAQAAALGNTGPMSKGATPARWSQEMSIAAVIELLKDMGSERFLALPLLMMESLANLDRGLTPDLLRPASIREQRILIKDARIMARAVRAIDMLTARDHPRRLSLDNAARRVHGTMAWFHLAKSPSALIELRKNVKRRRAIPDVMRMYNMPFPPEAGQTSAEKADWLLTTLKKDWGIRG